MTFRRIVCLSDPHPTASGEEILNLCRSYPTPNTLSGISGKLVALGEQFVLLLEGEPAGIEELVRRLETQVPGAGMKPRFRDTSQTRAFNTLAIEDVYVDELEHENRVAAAQLQDRLIDLLGRGESEERDLFGEIAELLSEPAAQPTDRHEVAA